MKTLLLAAAVAMLSTAAHACTPTAADYRALATSPSQLTPETFAALAPDDQATVCDTRSFIGAFKGVLTGPAAYSSDYLSPDENHKVVLATKAYLRLVLSKKGIGTATV